MGDLNKKMEKFAKLYLIKNKESWRAKVYYCQKEKEFMPLCLKWLRSYKMKLRDLNLKDELEECIMKMQEYYLNSVQFYDSIELNFEEQAIDKLYFQIIKKCCPLIIKNSNVRESDMFHQATAAYERKQLQILCQIWKQNEFFIPDIDEKSLDQMIEILVKTEVNHNYAKLYFDTIHHVMQWLKQVSSFSKISEIESCIIILKQNLKNHLFF